MIEKYFNIRRDDVKIYGFLNKVGSDDVVILLHGLGDDCHAHHIYNMNKRLNNGGVDTYRYNLFSGRKDGRRAHETSLLEMEKDFNAVLRMHSNRYSTVSVIGHSLGGSIAMLGNNELADKLLLWEPAIHPLKRHKNRLIEKQDHYLLDWGNTIGLSKTFVKELPTLNEKLVEGVKTDTTFFFAERSKIFEEWRDILSDYIVIPKASHRFDEKKAEEDLLDQTMEVL